MLLSVGAQERSVEELTGTGKSIGLAAVKAGWDVRAATTYRSVHLAGTRDGWAFSARQTTSAGWDVRIQRPGWPMLPSSVTELRAMFKAQLEQTKAVA